MVLPPGVITAFYGDDFTGSTDAMEVLSFAGLKTALFLRPPSRAQLARFGDLKAFGIAGTSRSMATEAMATELGPIFRFFRQMDIPLVHYKTCSTFDSGPHIGSIGRAIDIAQQELRSAWIPLLVAAPPLQRFCAFGNLFARSGLDSDIFRLDRHPTMAHHPTTPMAESDLRRHLSAQTKRSIGLFDLLHLEMSAPKRRRQLEQLWADQGKEIILFDGLYPIHLERIGHLVWEQIQAGQRLLAVGSSGVEYALVACLKAKGLLSPPDQIQRAKPVEQIVVVSGSCSPVTDRQIGKALENGFAEIPVEAALLADPAQRLGHIGERVEAGIAALEAGSGVIFHTARGPHDRRIAASAAAFAKAGVVDGDLKVHTAKVLGESLGEVLCRFLEKTGLQRGVVAGGDTSAYAAQEMSLEALEVIAPLAPGSPLCRAFSMGGKVDGLEIVFKGGQVGRDDFFAQVLAGG